jgi:hypothetical protein
MSVIHCACIQSSIHSIRLHLFCLVHSFIMIIPKSGATVALGIALLAGTEALPEAAAVRRQEVSASGSGEWSGRLDTAFLHTASVIDI